VAIFNRTFKLEKQRLSVLLFGAPKLGKTRTLLKLVKDGDFVVLISTDHGTLEVYRNPMVYEKRLVVAEVYNLTDMREALEEGKNIVRKVIKAGVPPSKVWAAIDTVTHLQIMLLTEARKISLRNPDAKDDRDEFVRDITTQADWGINLGLMSECANMLNSYPCNVVNVALERESRTTHRPEPALSGQSGARFLGDADLILRMAYEKGQGVKLLTSTHDGAGDRSGVLDEMEEPDLKVIRNKIFGDAEKGNEDGNQTA
jgi:hypothetical protein